jgi:GTP cyclohydrolase II
VTPTGVAGLQFVDEADAMNRAADELRAQGVRAMVVLVHEGIEQRGDWNDTSCPGAHGPLRDIARRLAPEIKVVFSGHTHQGYRCEVDGRLLIQGTSYGRGVSVVDVELDRASGTLSPARSINLPVLNELTDPAQRAKLSAAASEAFAGVLRETQPVASVTAKVASYVALARPQAEIPVGRIGGRFDSRRGVVDNPAGRLVADAQLAATRRHGAQIAFMNPAGIRSDLECAAPPCKVTFGDVFVVQPFGNSLITMTFTGAQLKAVLESQVGAGPPDRSVLQPSAGFTYTWRSDAPAGNKVSEMRLNGEPIRPDARYRVTVNSFLAAGGDGFSLFKEGTDPCGRWARHRCPHCLPGRRRAQSRPDAAHQSTAMSDDSNDPKDLRTMGRRTADHIVLSSHPSAQSRGLAHEIHWGAPTAKERGPVIASLTNVAQRNAIGTHGGAYAVYRALAVASGTLQRDHRPDFTDTAPAESIGPHPQWSDPDKIVSLDPWGHMVSSAFATEIAAGADVRPSIAITKAHINMPELKGAIAAGRLKPDGDILTEAGDVRVTKAAIDPVWYLPGIARRFDLKETSLRRALFEQTAGMFPELVTRPDLKVFLPPIGGMTLYFFGDVEKLGQAGTRIACRLHDECNGSDVFGSDICTCRPVSRPRHRGLHRDGAAGRRGARGLQPQGGPRARAKSPSSSSTTRASASRAATARKPTSRAPSASRACRTCASSSSCPTSSTGSASRGSTSGPR